jgi:site-specific recombinase XerD
MIGERLAAYRDAQKAPAALAALTTAEARARVVALQSSSLAPVSVAGFVRGHKAISACWAAEGYVPEDPLRRLVRSRAPQRLIETLTPAELERLLAVPRSRERLLIGARSTPACASARSPTCVSRGSRRDHRLSSRVAGPGCEASHPETAPSR